jgi:AcrR family transcriptional regulator
MTVMKQQLPVRDRILEVAFDLFYRQGYRATGINQIIAESGVAKASFYDHFPSKDHLLSAYAVETSRRECEEMRAGTREYGDATERFLAPLRMLLPWFRDTHYRGCPFQNLMAEVPTNTPEVQQVAEQHRESIRELMRELFLELRKTMPELGSRDVEDVVATYLLLFEGAIATAVAYQADWPVEQAISALKRYIGINE